MTTVKSTPTQMREVRKILDCVGNINISISLTSCQSLHIERGDAIVPRLRDSTNPMTRLLKGYDINGANLAVALSCAPKTARAKLENPDKLTLGDLRVIHYRFGIPCDEIRERVI